MREEISRIYTEHRPGRNHKLACRTVFFIKTTKLENTDWLERTHKRPLF